MKRSFLVRPGDLNAFFGLMLDNVTQLVILSGILIGVFGFPKELVFYKIIPGSVVGVLIGDLVYSTMAIRLARKTGAFPHANRDASLLPTQLENRAADFAYAEIRARLALRLRGFLASGTGPADFPAAAAAPAVPDDPPRCADSPGC